MADRKIAASVHARGPGFARRPFAAKIGHGRKAARRTMKCPFCHEGDFAVVDSRSRGGDFPIRRRRACSHCKRKAWTTEQLVDAPLQVVKKDESREPFDPEKVRRGLEKA